MPKTKNELDTLRKEYSELKARLQELSDDELLEVAGGNDEEDQKIYLVYFGEKVLVGKRSVYMSPGDRHCKLSDTIRVYSYVYDLDLDPSAPLPAGHHVFDGVKEITLKEFLSYPMIPGDGEIV